MQDAKIYYQRFGRHCFQTLKDYHFESRIKTGHPFDSTHLSYDGNGQFIIKKGRCSDGPSDDIINPFEVTQNFFRGAFEHDAKYWAMRSGSITADVWRKTADQELKERIMQDGMSIARAEAVYLAVREFGENSTLGGNPILEAP